MKRENMHNLKITIVQTYLEWEDIDLNLERFDTIVNTMTGDTDLIVLPEMFTTGFTMNAEKFAETMDGKAVSWMKKKSMEKKTDIAGSMIIKENKKFFNRLIWAKPSEELFFYDKRHLFRYSGEEKIFTPGSDNGSANVIVSLKGWRIRPFICYDLRFPVWTRNYQNLYDIAVFVANWPETRSCHWKALLMARAVENQAYVIGVNRIGQDGNGLEYSGDSSIIGPNGRIIFHKASTPCVHTQALSFNALQDHRVKFPAAMDADNFIIT